MKNTIKNILILVILTAIVFYLQTQTVKAAWGDFDTSFGLQGAVVESLTDYYPLSVAIQPDRKILVTGYRLLANKQRFFLRRYLSNGQIDTSFGNNGSAVSNALIVTNGNYRGVSIVVQPDGKIAVAGVGNGYFAVWRFNSNGYGDSTIGNGGLRTLSNYSTNYADNSIPTLAVQNGKLIVGLNKTQALVLLRLNTNGTLDTTFGNQGEAATGLITFSGFPLLVEAASGKITIGGCAPPNYRFSAERKLLNGQNDPDFAATVSDIGCLGTYAPGFVKLSNQKYVFQLIQPTQPQFPLPEVDRLLQFGANGVFESPINYHTSESTSTPSNCPNVLAQQGDGKVIASGQDRMYRFNSNLDVNTAEINFCSSFVNLTNRTRGVLQTNDRMVVAGRYNGYLTLVRTLAN